ncbi:CAP domain-containing protein [Paraburkholderia azotifigens]|uniref:CAP domain-containing protein n=1 Tax=Paraburkholderia azotifigens TaxID=2057004 RepID=UPI00317F4FA7
MKKNISALTAISFATVLALSACGGGGGGSSGQQTSAAAPATNSGSLQTSVATPTYASSSMQATTFAQINSYRQSMGVGLLAQDAALDTAANAHALYLATNVGNGSIPALTHTEVSSNAAYYGDTPLSRAQKAGVASTESVGEDVAAWLLTSASTPSVDAANCLPSLLDSVYHLVGATDTFQTIGIGLGSADGSHLVAGGIMNACTLDFGRTASGQQMPTTAIAHVPLSNETNVFLQMFPETPNPAPDLTTPGRPIMVRVNAANQGDVLTVTSFTLTTSSGSVVPTRIIVPSQALAGSTSSATADVNSGELPAGVAFLLPLAPLSASTTYTVSFSGARDSTPVNVTWSFTTGTQQL